MQVGNFLNITIAFHERVVGVKRFCYRGGMKTREDAVRDLLSALPHFRLAMAEAQTLAGTEGTAGIAVVALKQDGSGQITARFEAPRVLRGLGSCVGRRTVH